MEKMPLARIMEGNAELYVPRESFKDPFHLPVFYNPAMGFNRSISSVAMGCALKLIDDSVIVDGLCSLGARGIRYAKENKVRKAYFVDANPAAIKVLRRNLKLNKIRNAQIAEIDLNRFFSNSREYFDFIEIDPFGSPVFFLQNAIRRLSKKGVLSITATDMSSLAGAYPNACIKHYGARPVRCEYSHEIALRILLGKIGSELMLQDFGCKPLLSFYKGHAVKAIVLCEKNAKKADEAILEIGFVSHCARCLDRRIGKRQIEKCGNCGNSLEIGGPLWIGKLSDGDFLGCMEKEGHKRGHSEQSELSEFIKILKNENDFPPAFFDMHVLARKQKKRIIKMGEALLLLEKEGFGACKTHYSPTSFKTNAPLSEIIKAF